MSAENPVRSRRKPELRKREDTPVEREQAYHAFKIALDTKFLNNPDKITTDRHCEDIDLANSDPRVASMNVTRLTVTPNPRAFISGDYLDIEYDNKRVLYMYTPDREVIKWTVDRERTGPPPTIPALPGEDESLEEKLRLYQELTYRVIERNKYLREELSNLLFEQRMKQNGQPVSAQEALTAVEMINKGIALVKD